MAARSAAAATCLSVWHSVPERASYGTEYACRAQKGFLWYATHFRKHSVRKNRLFRYGRDIRCTKTPFFCTEGVFRGTRCAKRGFSGTEEIFGAKNSLLWYTTHLQRPAEQPTPQTVDSLLPHATHFQRRAVPKAAPAAPDASSVRETAPALFVRSGPFHHFLRPANAELVSGGPFPCSFDGTRDQKQPPLGGEQLLTCSNEKWSSATCASTKLRKNPIPPPKT